MSPLQTVHTAGLDGAERGALRRLLEEAFAGGFGDEDFEHCLGGMHAIAWEAAEPIAHAAVVMRRVLHRGRALRCGYVEAVAVRSDRRRRGHGGAVMGAVEQIIRCAYDFGALGATDAGAALYTSRGWRRWTGTTSVVAPGGLRRTPEEDGSIYVLPLAVELDWNGDLACDWRDGDVW
jgi:aminoglycoside 2'-N-acetyltransferase I